MWQDKAACKNADSALFLTGVTSRVEQAKAICKTCPVLEQCLAFAIDNDDFEQVVYGGLLGHERKALVS
jgi:WhiB family redox-sensing transcriptional regulator